MVKSLLRSFALGIFMLIAVSASASETENQLASDFERRKFLSELFEETGLRANEIEVRAITVIPSTERSQYQLKIEPEGIFLATEKSNCRFTLGYTYNFQFNLDQIGWKPEYKSAEAVALDSLECY